MVHPLAPGVEITIDLAVTAPVVLAVPMALAHLPTARSEAVAAVRSVNVVEEVRVTTTLEVFFVCGLVSLTVTFEPLTAVTGPGSAAEPSGPAPEAPATRPGAAALAAEAATRRPLTRSRPAPRAAPTAATEAGATAETTGGAEAPAQEPDVGWVMETVVAVTGSPKALVPDDVDDAGFPKAEMHDPTVTLAEVAVTVWSKVVVGV